MSLRIKEIIKEKGLTIQLLAGKMDITRVGLSQHINGNPSVEVLERIADALNVEIWELFKHESKQADKDSGMKPKRPVIIQNIKIMDKKYLTLQEAAKYLDVSEDALKELTTTGSIEAYKPTDELMYYGLDQIEAFITGKPAFGKENVNQRKSPPVKSKMIEPPKPNGASKPVNQYTMSGEYIKTFDSCRDAERQMGFAKSVISKCCTGKSKSSGGYQWKFSEESEAKF